MFTKLAALPGDRRRRGAPVTPVHCNDNRAGRRLAGLRTNTLVALGAASFVVFEAIVPQEASPTRVAAQVVSGIGFLGAGLIFREGMSGSGLSGLCRARHRIRRVRQSSVAADRQFHQSTAAGGERGRDRIPDRVDLPRRG